MSRYVTCPECEGYGSVTAQYVAKGNDSPVLFLDANCPYCDGTREVFRSAAERDFPEGTVLRDVLA